MNIKTLCSESEQDSLQFTLIVRLWHVLELRLNHARHGGHGLARPRGPHHVSHVRAVGADSRRGHAVPREGRVAARSRDHGEDLALALVGGRLVVGAAVHLLEAGGGGGGAGLGPVLGGRGRNGRGMLRLGRAGRTSSSGRPHVLCVGWLGLRLGHDGQHGGRHHLTRHGATGQDHPHDGRPLLLARPGVDAWLRSWVAGSHELLVRVVRVGPGQYWVSRHLQRGRKVRTTSSSAIAAASSSSTIVLPALDSLITTY